MKTKLIILVIITAVLGGLWYWTSTKPNWETYENSQLGFEFKYPSLFYPTSDAPKDKYCDKPYDYIFLQSSSEAIDIRISILGSSCSWLPLPVSDASYSQSLSSIGGFKVDKYIKTGIERDISLVYSFNYNDKVIDIFGNKNNYSDSYSESVIEQIISSFKFTK